MGTIKRSLLACLAACALPAALAQPAVPAARGELLYSTHCIACHSREIHWRQKKLATDWASLMVQVRRWAGNGGLGWSEEEIGDVARYLNAVHYRFAAPSVTGSETGGRSRSIAQASDPGQAGPPAPWLRGRRDAVPPEP
jgi:mono/diheme cytochrome c family protein